MMLAIVCDFPVPGGPSRTKVRPTAAQVTAWICDPSAGSGSDSAASSVSPTAGSPTESAKAEPSASTR